MSTFTLAAPENFRYASTINSHGWCLLPPFGYDEGSATLSRIQRLSDGRIVRLAVSSGNDRSVNVAVEGQVTPAQQAEISAIVARCLGFEQDLNSFYSLLRQHPEYAWIEQIGAGRMLVSPTIFEDLAKTLLTTNTTWNMTRQMVARLAALGEPYDGGHAFPTPERLASFSADELNAQVNAGYRGAYLRTLAAQIASGQLDVESWRDPNLTGAELYKRLKTIKGFGDYAAGAMLRLLGRFDELGLDSECRRMYKGRHNGGTPATDKEIAAYYAPFGQWRGLVVWMEVMQDWLVS
jgi:3-methyladenine DNA glycosylase/8-oxoguanine DNA glycosylase